MLFKFFTSILLISFCLPAFSYKIEGNFTGLINQDIVLACYFGDEKTIVDRTESDSTGFFTFSDNKLLPAGLYMIGLPDSNSIELLLPSDNQNIQLFGNYPDLADLKCYGNPISIAFIKYNKSFSALMHEKRAIQKELLLNFTDKVMVDSLKSILIELNDEIIKHEDQYLDKYAQSELWEHINYSQILKRNVFRTVDTINDMKKILDSLYLNSNYLIRSPFARVILDDFLGTITKFKPTDINLSLDHFLSILNDSSENYQFYLSAFYNYFNESRNSDYEQVFIHLAQNYYLQEPHPYWINTPFLERLEKEIIQISLFQPGNKFLLLSKYFGKQEVNSLNSDKKKIVAFIDNDCSKCLTDLQKLSDNSFKNYDIIIFDLGDKLNHHRLSSLPLNWQKFSKYTERDNISELFVLSTTPVYFLLDNSNVTLYKTVEINELLKE